MVQIFAVNENNDLYLKNGRMVVVNGIQAVMQACEHAAKTLLGEMVLATNQGIPYFQSVWIGVPNFQQFEAALRNAFLAVPNVVEVVSLTVVQTKNVLTYTAVIRTNFGVGTIANGELLNGDVG